jgi:hypothetical protein
MVGNYTVACYTTSRRGGGERKFLLKGISL